MLTMRYLSYDDIVLLGDWELLDCAVVCLLGCHCLVARLTDGLLTDLIATGLTDAGQMLCVVAGGELTHPCSENRFWS
jgi:hypothetical protein